MRRRSMTRSLPLPVLTALMLAAPPVIAAAPTELPLPEGIWELAATHQAPFEMRTLEPLAGVLVVSDLAGSVAAVRPDSGLVVWTRKVSVIESLGGVWPLATDGGGLVLVAGTTLSAYRADVGTRLWERALGCQKLGCIQRVVHAASHDDGKTTMLFLAGGGLVQTELARLDPKTGQPLWRRAVEVQHPRRALSRRDLLVVEDAVAPYTVRFIDPVDGVLRGTWDPSSSGIEGAVTELMLLADGRTVAVHLRPGDDALALVTVLSPEGREITGRRVPRPAQVTNQPVLATPIADGLAIFTPEPQAGVAYVTTMLLAEPWSARTEQVRTWSEPLPVAERWVLAPSVRAPGASWSSIGGPRWAIEPPGVDADPQRTRSFVAGRRVALIDHGDSRGRNKAHAIVTVDAVSGRLHGLGAHDLGSGQLDRAVALGEDLVLTRGRTIFRLVLVPWRDAVAKLRETRAQGVEIQPWLQRFARFGTVSRALNDGLRGGASNDRPGPATSLPGGDAFAPLSPEDERLVAALREAWLAKPSDGIAGLVGLLEQAPERSERRHTLLAAFSGLILELVLAPGLLPRGEDVDSNLVAMARMLERESAERAPDRHVAAIYGAVMALLDEALTGADLLARVTPDQVVSEARLELARRSLHLLRKSAGTLRTETSRQTLVSALRLFPHLDALFGPEATTVGALLDRVAAHDIDATRELDALIAETHGLRAQKKGAGPALCQLACEATLAFCGDAKAGDVIACQTRCTKTGAVRFSSGARPSVDPRWLCR